MTDATQTPGAPPSPPSTPAEAATQLAQLKADPNFMKPFMAGGPSQLKQFKDLHELIDRGDNYDLAIAGQLAPGEVQSSDHVQNIGAASMLRELGMPDSVVGEVLRGETATPKEFYDKVALQKKELMSNPEWVKLLFSGDQKARAQLAIANIILTGKIKDEKAA